MQFRNLISSSLRSFRLSLPIVAVSVTGAARAGATPSFSPVEVLATPNAQCLISGDGVTQPATLWADDLGVVKFHALRAAPTDAIRHITVNCVDDSGKKTTLPLDLASDTTFKPLPPVPVPPSVYVRPALTGDPMQYSWEELLHRGYGNRPDPAKSPRAYATWLQDVSVPLRQTMTVHPDVNSAVAHRGGRARTPDNTGANGTNNVWTGGVLNSPGQGGSTQA